MRVEQREQRMAGTWGVFLRKRMYGEELHPHSLLLAPGLTKREVNRFGEGPSMNETAQHVKRNQRWLRWLEPAM